METKREQGAQKNTDREIWRRKRTSDCIDDYYQPSIHVTEGGGIGINVGGTVYVKSVEEWHQLAGGPLTLKDFERVAQPAEPSQPGTATPLEHKGICDHCKKPVEVRMNEAWHTKGDKVWHEICSYQQQIEQLTAQLEMRARADYVLDKNIAAAPQKQAGAELSDRILKYAHVSQRAEVSVLLAEFARAAGQAASGAQRIGLNQGTDALELTGPKWAAPATAQLSAEQVRPIVKEVLSRLFCERTSSRSSYDKAVEAWTNEFVNALLRSQPAGSKGA